MTTIGEFFELESSDMLLYTIFDIDSEEEIARGEAEDLEEFENWTIESFDVSMAHNDYPILCFNVSAEDNKEA